jgi:hypothetical protein
MLNFKSEYKTRFHINHECVDFDDESPFNRKFRKEEPKMAKTGYVGNRSTATVGNILYWSRGYSTAAGVCAECRAVRGEYRKPNCHCSREHHPVFCQHSRSDSPSNRERRSEPSERCRSVRELDRAIRVKQQLKAITTS